MRPSAYNQALWDARRIVVREAGEVLGEDVSRHALRETITAEHVTVEHVRAGVLVRLPTY